VSRVPTLNRLRCGNAECLRRLIQILSEDTAFSVTYYTSHHFSKNAPMLVSAVEGKMSAYGQYQDHWVKTESGWKICHRNMIYMGPLVGNPEIVGALQDNLAG
jgi:hypothetical protein